MRLYAQISTKENGVPVFMCTGLGIGRYFIGIGNKAAAPHYAITGLVNLFWCVFIKVPYEYRGMFIRKHKAKQEPKQTKLYRLDLNLYEQPYLGLFWKYTLFGQKSKYRLLRMNKRNARYLLAPYKYSNAR